jgi:hypothetical protein
VRAAFAAGLVVGVEQSALHAVCFMRTWCLCHLSVAASAGHMHASLKFVQFALLLMQ